MPSPSEYPRDMLIIEFKRGDTFSVSMSVLTGTGEEVLRTRAELERAQNRIRRYREATETGEEAGDSAELSDDARELLGAYREALEAHREASVRSIDGWTLRSQLRRFRKKVADLDVTITDPVRGEFTLSKSAGETALWPVRDLFCDVEFLKPDGTVVSSDTFMVRVVLDITNNTEDGE